MSWDDMIEKKCVVCGDGFEEMEICADVTNICKECDAKRKLYEKICEEIDNLIDENSNDEFFKKDYAEYVQARFRARAMTLTHKSLFGDPKKTAEKHKVTA